ncbi:MAG TPA: lipocalin-like domain-containing protein, partial [Candidatus Binataceae bacterium]|nr:lipocalin-like domain-containing protein [Candidatus Binataceae bacterium]
EENRATVQGMLTFFGTYTIGDDNNSLTYRIQGSSYPNFNGRITKRTASISDDRLKITFAGSARGGAGYQIWKRLK